MNGMLDPTCMYDLEWYTYAPIDKYEPTTPRRSRFLLNECMNSEATYSKPPAKMTTYWFEPIVLVYQGPAYESFKFSYAFNPIEEFTATNDEWASFKDHVPIWFGKKKRLMHFLGARAYEGRVPSKKVEPIVLINAPNITGNEREIYKRLRDLSDFKLSGHQPYMYISECERLNKRFLESVTEEL